MISTRLIKRREPRMIRTGLNKPKKPGIISTRLIIPERASNDWYKTNQTEESR